MDKQLIAVSGYNALSPQQQQAHRSKIGVRAEAILRQFWRDDETPDAIQAIEIEGWCDVLENCSHSEIRAAWAGYQKTGARTKNGKLYKPDAGALYIIILNARPKPKPVPKPIETQREPMATKERRAEIIAEEFGDEVPASLRGLL